MTTIYLDKSCIGTVISEVPYVELLSIPRQEDNKWIATANVNGMLAIVELKVTKLE